jgi:hypothetical protein
LRMIGSNTYVRKKTLGSIQFSNNVLELSGFSLNLIVLLETFQGCGGGSD